MNRVLRGAIRSSLAFGVLLALAPGCRNSQEEQAEQAAKQALGVQKNGETTTGETTREVVVKEDRSVIDAQTGEVLKVEHKATPVTIKTEVRKDVDVNVGKTQAATTPR